MPNLGYPEVRERLAADVDFVGVRGEHIAVCSGAGAAISLALRAVVDPGEEVICSLPYFGEYAAYCAAAQAQFVPVPTATDMSLDIDAVAAALTPRTAALILNSPCNPTGHVVAAADLAAVAALLEAHVQRHDRRVVLIVDEVYRNLVYAPAARAEPFTAYPWTMLARSFSKDLGLAGERIGYLAVHPEMATSQVMRGLEVCQRALGFVNAPATMQRMLLHLERFPVDVDAHRRHRDIALAMARDRGLEPVATEGGLYLWTPAPWRDGLGFATALAARRVLVAPGIAFGAPDWLRLCFSAPEETLQRGLRILAEVAAEREAMPAG
jgi:aspartate aminotransferase